MNPSNLDTKSLEIRYRSSRGPDWTLRLTVIVTACTAAWIAWTGVSPVNGWLFMGHGTSEASANLVEEIAAVGLVLASVLLLWRPKLGACSLLAAWMLLLAWAKFSQGGEAFAHLAPLAHAVRYCAPIALWMLHKGREDGASRLMRCAVAATFLTHGFEALQHSARFVDILIPAMRGLFDWRIREAQAETLLTVIGVVDVLAGLAILAKPGRWIAGWMALWGLVTLLSRPLAWGIEFWPESGIRAANAGVPMALLLYWLPRSRAKGDSRDGAG